MRTSLSLSVLATTALLASSFRIPIPVGVRAQSPMTMSTLDRPLDTLTGLTRLIDELNNDVFFGPSAITTPFWRRTTDMSGPLSAVASFKVDLSETEKEYLVRADVPGVNREDIKISVDDGMLSISAERKQEYHSDKRKEGEEAVEKNEKAGGEETIKGKEAQFHFSEVSYGKVYRSFKLPANADPDSIKASLDNGVLSVKLPKRELPRERTIEIQ